MGVSYATKRDLYRFGLPRGTLGAAGRLVAGANVTTEAIELEEHGFVDGDVVAVRAVAGSTLPAPLAEGTAYYVKFLTESTFQLALTDGGAAVNLTTAGGEMMISTPLDFDAVLEWASRFADGCVPHLLPIAQVGGAYPLELVEAVSTLAAAKLQFLSGTTSVAMGAQELATKAKLERWAKGTPIREVATSSNLAVTVGASSASAERVIP